MVQENRRKLKELIISAPPKVLGAYEEKYHVHKGYLKSLKETLDRLDEEVNIAIDSLKPKSLEELVGSELRANANYLNRRIKFWVSESKSLISSEQERLESLQAERSKIYAVKMSHIVDQVTNGFISLREASKILDAERDFHDAENSELFETYVSAIASLRDQIDLAGLAQKSEEVADGLRTEVDRLHALAQLGITVEIIGHEIESLEQNVSSNLKLFPEDIKNKPEYFAVVHAHESLIDRLRFLSPLKLSGSKARVRITGEMIFEYTANFFKSYFSENNIEFCASENFLSFSLVEQPSRIYPVFINLINNSAYWVGQQAGIVRKIMVDATDNLVFVTDNGPGVDAEDIPQLFQLFFTKKIRGGRGVGLYLCRTNLAAGGHIIDYISTYEKGLGGASFRINFKGAKYV
ncbi:ATP-binding protein [Pseudomonas viridiflava]|uniref:ATP-binding protein n=1 Tax=Pseudomonas viridiflava TaxID=33069 RepID=UPI0013D043B1|nr:HAMP domain-containing sensor histidine kinase [Pseudomonas viridiflava]